MWHDMEYMRELLKTTKTATYYVLLLCATLSTTTMASLTQICSLCSVLQILVLQSSMARLIILSRLCWIGACWWPDSWCEQLLTEKNTQMRNSLIGTLMFWAIGLMTKIVLTSCDKISATCSSTAIEGKVASTCWSVCGGSEVTPVMTSPLLT